MAWTSPKTWTVGEVLTAANMNLHVRDNLNFLGTHVHDGDAGDGSASLGPLVLTDFTDAVAPAAPGAGKTRLYTTSGRVGYRAGAAGAAKTLVDQDSAETLVSKTLTAPTIVDFTNAQHDHGDADDGGLVPGAATIIRKAADETVNNSSTLQNDDALVLAVGASDLWAVRAFIRVNGGAGGLSPEFKSAWTVPAAASFVGIAIRKTTADVDDLVLGENDLTAVLTSDNESGESEILIYDGVYIGGGTAGNLQLQWAQNTAQAQNTIVKANSYIIAHKLS